MKGLVRIPAVEELRRAYEWMQAAGEPIPAPELALWTQWCRFDPRLAEQWVLHVARFWKRISPAELRERVLELPWPAAVGVLLEELKDSGFVDEAERRLFMRWAAVVTESLPRASGMEQFFIGLRAFAGKLMRQDAERPLKSYRKWGYLGREVLVNKAGPSRTRLSAEVRRRVLRELMASQKRFTVQEYRRALGGNVGVRQAQLDLEQEPRLIARGRTRGRFYIVR